MSLDVNIEALFRVNGHRIRIGVLASDPGEALRAMYDAAGAIGAAVISDGEIEDEEPSATAIPNTPIPPAPPTSPQPRRRGRRSNAEIAAAQAAAAAPTAPAAQLPSHAAPLVSMGPPMSPPAAPHVEVKAPGQPHVLQQLKDSVAATPPQPQYPQPQPSPMHQPYANPNGMWSPPAAPQIERSDNWRQWNAALKEQITLIKRAHGPGVQGTLDSILNQQGGNIDNMSEAQMDVVWRTLQQAFPPAAPQRSYGG